MLTDLLHRVSRIRPAAAITWLLLGIFSTTAEPAAPSHPSQSEVEAVYLVDFGKFGHWPGGSDQGPMNLCVAGLSSFSTGLEKVVANENISGRTLGVRRVWRPEDESNCAILFIDTTQQDHIDELLQAVADKPTLTVSDLPGFLSRGGMIQFQLVEKRVRFSVNLAAVTHVHLTISSELLKVAVNVKGRTPDGGAQ